MARWADDPTLSTSKLLTHNNPEHDIDDEDENDFFCEDEPHFFALRRSAV
jgi:hypothetical protein